MATKLTPEQQAAWERISPETVIGSPLAVDQDRLTDASEVLDDMSL